MTRRDKTTWESIDPFEKASQWVRLAPEIAPQLVAMVKVVADHRQAQEEKEFQHRREQEQRESEHRREMERRNAAHNRLMDTRLWITQIVAMSVNTVGLVLLCIVAIQFGKDAVAPALAVVGAGGGLTAGSYAVGSSIRRAWKRTKRDELTQAHSEN